MLRTIYVSTLQSLLSISTSQSQHSGPAKTGYSGAVNAFLKRRALRFCWRCSNMADECFNVAHKMREYY